MISSRLGTLRVYGRDSSGIITACTKLLTEHGCNILNSEQWTDKTEGQFFQRIAFSYYDDNNDVSSTSTRTSTSLMTSPTPPTATNKIACQEELNDVCDFFQLESSLNWRDRRKKVGIMVSKYDHCLWELLLRHSARELDIDIDVVISNHDDLRPVAESFHIPYHVTPITPENKIQQEAKQLELLHNVDVVVLARYMQVLSDNFLNQFPNQIINIHHSFLPAFMGGNPYHRAWDRGVKLIGATAHFATPDLDEGPIIEQDVIQVTHRDEVKDMLRKGRILERNVLLKALEAHLDDRVIVHKNRCVVFGD